MAAETKVILRTPDDWESFEIHLHRQARSLKLLDYLLERKELLPEPTPPNMENYKKSRQHPPITTLTVAATQQTHQEDDPAEGSSRDVQPQPIHPQTSQPTDEVLTYGGMTEAAQRAFQFAHGIYLDQRKRHERETDMIKKLEDWIIGSTAQHYTDTCCKPTENVRTWYTMLKQSAALKESLVRDLAKRTYEAAVKPLKKEPKDYEVWITTWERALDKAIEKEIPAVTNPEDWLRDFLKALQPIRPNWVESFYMLHGDSVEQKILSFRDVGNKLRTAVREFDSKSERTRLATGSFLTAVVDLPSQQSQANEQISSADGSFGVATATGRTGPTFAGSGNQHTKADAPGDRRQRFNKSTRLRAGSKRPNTDSEPSTPWLTICKGCGQRGHHYSNCFYLFPERAPSRFRPRSELQAYTKVLLQNNTFLAEEVQRMRLHYRKRNNPSTIAQKETSKQLDSNNASDVD